MLRLARGRFTKRPYGNGRSGIAPWHHATRTGMHTTLQRATPGPANISVGAVREPPMYAWRKRVYMHRGIAQRVWACIKHCIARRRAWPTSP